MEATLKFDLPEEQDLLNDAINVAKWKNLVWEIDQKLRNALKWRDDLSEEVYRDFEELRGFIHEYCVDHGINIYE